MFRNRLYLLFLLPLLFVSSSVFAQKKGTWTGEIVNITCYTKTQKVNKAYKKCVSGLVKQNPDGFMDPNNVQPMMLVLGDGNTFRLLFTSADGYLEMLKAILVGASADGMVTGVLTDVKSLQEKGVYTWGGDVATLKDIKVILV